MMLSSCRTVFQEMAAVTVSSHCLLLSLFRSISIILSLKVIFGGFNCNKLIFRIMHFLLVLCDFGTGAAAEHCSGGSSIYIQNASIITIQ